MDRFWGLLGIFVITVGLADSQTGVYFEGTTGTGGSSYVRTTMTPPVAGPRTTMTPPVAGPRTTMTKPNYPGTTYGTGAGSRTATPSNPAGPGTTAGALGPDSTTNGYIVTGGWNPYTGGWNPYTGGWNPYTGGWNPYTDGNPGTDSNPGTDGNPATGGWNPGTDGWNPYTGGWNPYTGWQPFTGGWPVPYTDGGSGPNTDGGWVPWTGVINTNPPVPQPEIKTIDIVFPTLDRGTMIPWGTTPRGESTYEPGTTAPRTEGYTTGYNTAGGTTSSTIEPCGMYVVLSSTLQCRGTDITGDYKAIKMSGDFSKVVYIKSALNSEDVHDYKTRLIMDAYQWSIISNGVVIAYTINRMPDGGLCFNEANSLLWTVFCEDGNQFNTIPLDYNTVSDADNIILGSIFQNFAQGEQCLPTIVQPKQYNITVTNPETIADEACYSRVVGLYEYREGTFGGFQVYESVDTPGVAFYNSINMMGFMVGRQTALLDIFAVEPNLNVEDINFDPMTRDVCPDSIDSLFFVCPGTGETILASVEVAEVQKGGYSYTYGLEPFPVKVPYKDSLYTSLPRNPDIYTGMWRPATPDVSPAATTPIHPATGGNNRRWCAYQKFTIEEFPACGLKVNGDYVFGGDFAGYRAVYEKLTPLGEDSLVPKEKVYIYYIRKWRKWVLGTGYLDGEGIIASFRHEGECPYARGSQEMKILDEGYCEGLTADERHEVRVTALKGRSNIEEDGVPMDSAGFFLFTVINVYNFNPNIGEVSVYCQEQTSIFGGIYMIADDNKVMGNRKVYQKVEFSETGINVTLAADPQFLWYSESHKAWVVSAEIGMKTEPLLYTSFNYELQDIGGSVTAELPEVPWYFVCEGVNSAAGISMYSLPESTAEYNTGEVETKTTTAASFGDNETDTAGTAVTAGSTDGVSGVTVTADGTVSTDDVSVVTGTPGPVTQDRRATAEELETDEPTTETSTELPTEAVFIPPSVEEDPEPEPFVPTYNIMSTKFVLTGSYCRSVAERRAVKTAVKIWEVFNGTCFEDDSCELTTVNCKEDAEQGSFAVQMSFKQLKDPETGLSAGLEYLYVWLGAITPASVSLSVQTPDRRKRAVESFAVDAMEVEAPEPKCPTGSVSNAEGNCEWCLSGTYASEGMCVECAVDTYQDQIGQATCKACPVGTTTLLSTGSVICEDEDSIIDILEEGLSTTIIIVIAAVAGVIVIIVVAITVCCVVQKKKNRVTKLSNRVSPEPGRDNHGYVNSRTSVQSHR